MMSIEFIFSHPLGDHCS